MEMLNQDRSRLHDGHAAGDRRSGTRPLGSHASVDGYNGAGRADGLPADVEARAICRRFAVLGATGTGRECRRNIDVECHGLYQRWWTRPATFTTGTYPNKPQALAAMQALVDNLHEAKYLTSEIGISYMSSGSLVYEYVTPKVVLGVGRGETLGLAVHARCTAHLRRRSSSLTSAAIIVLARMQVSYLRATGSLPRTASIRLRSTLANYGIIRLRHGDLTARAALKPQAGLPVRWSKHEISSVRTLHRPHTVRRALPLPCVG